MVCGTHSTDGTCNTGFERVKYDFSKAFAAKMI